MDDQKLISLCIKGDKKAQKLLYDRFANQMFRVCLRYTGNCTDAEDVLVIAFFKVFNNLKNFEYKGNNSLSKWIVTIMINESLMFLRKKRKFTFEEADNSLAQVPNDEESEIDAEQIYQLILRLPDGYRTVLNLFVIDGLSHEEIANQLGISISTSKSQLSRARALLKDQLFKLQDNGR